MCYNRGMNWRKWLDDFVLAGKGILLATKEKRFWYGFIPSFFFFGLSIKNDFSHVRSISLFVIFRSGINFFKSIELVNPKPEQVWQAPTGALNENILGVISPIVVPQLGQA